MTIKCCIVDDEPLARSGIEGYVEKIPYLNCSGTFSSAIDLLSELEILNPELLFLDIQMPHLTGLDFVKSLKNPPKVIFTTAYDQYALEGFELDVIDYLMKPISFDRFLKATEKAKLLLKDTRDSFFVKTDKRMEKVRFDDILYIESMQNYVIVNVNNEKLITHTTLKSMTENLPENFIQIHKQYIINKRHIAAIEGNQIVLEGNKLPISRTYREKALNAIMKA
ncbi:LytR/AlgR family response regulator transcription factor [Ekhidna sp.]|uniref:LytR/AlgR family response regulator transcription factor n=1 Tax=Ekhidna sp. TaxID=2608089 RepID=UPI003B508701